MSKFFQWLKEGAGSRTLQVSILSNGKFEAVAIEKGNIVSKHTATTGDAALVGVAVGIMNATDKPFSGKLG
jgi:hypothetical protein